MKRNAIITFDYEVFLGPQTGTIENSVFKPTEQILKILKENNAKAIFFVDATWLLFLLSYFPDDFNLISAQLKEIIKAGSSVELHLHPQWLQANREGAHVLFGSTKYYRLHSLSQEGIIDVFKESIEILESITSQKVKCFRAGGFCIDPFDQIKSAFETFEIKYDFSVVPGMSLKGGNEYDYDFSKLSDTSYFHFEDDVKNPDPNGNFIEIPLSTYQNNPLYRLINKLLLKYSNDRIFGDGKGIQEKSHYFLRSLSRRLSFSKAFLTSDNNNHRFFKFLLKRHFNRHSLIVLISHPKTLSRQGLTNISFVTKKYNTYNSEDLSDLLSS